MTTTEQRLADALRAVLPFAERDVSELADLACDDDSEDEAMAANADVERAREALAAYDAQQAQPVPAGAWSANAGSVWDHTGKWVADCNSENAARIVACVNAHNALVSALLGVMPYAENEVSAIHDLADDGDEHADEECEQATAALESARAALEAAGAPNA